MNSSLIFQYIIVLLIVGFACYSLLRVIRKNFAPKKFSSKGGGCDKDCGCS
ncbi:hypothetical protein [Chryseobacterium sp. LAM-KRS1]|uniref:hypothetical protein n=1 Tax=Chryseobacterium sp. LAM-KRS1 TaxID=2715754 RepID=UPI001553038D|nr:hypothetical protein [Chryseobacterium sp. LAM-KRS1]